VTGRAEPDLRRHLRSHPARLHGQRHGHTDEAFQIRRNGAGGFARRGLPQLTSGALSWDAVDIIVADPAEKLPFLFTKSATGRLHWHRPAAHA
jgi:hypothetical protein